MKARQKFCELTGNLSQTHQWRKLTSLISALILGISISACSNSTTWKEEALQHDGSKIIVERSLKRGGPHEVGSRGGSVYQSLTFQMPVTLKEIVWEDKRSEDLNTASFSPMALNVVDNTAYVVASPAGCLPYNKWGRPNPPYVVFKYQGQDWSRIPLEKLPAEIKLPNLNISSPDDKGKEIGGVVSFQTIQRLNAVSRMPQYLSIVREPVANFDPSCSVMVGDGKGRWDGLGWFEKQPNLEACENYCKSAGFDEKYCPCKKLFEGKKL
jgi:hypothetical protein